MIQSAVVHAQRAMQVPYVAPPSGLVRIEVRAPQPVHVMVVDEAGLAHYPTGQYPTYAGSRGRAYHVFGAMLPPGLLWYLLIENPWPEPLTVQYQVTAQTPPSAPTGYFGPTGPTGWG
jgi:hypothetical protein